VNDAKSTNEPSHHVLLPAIDQRFQRIARGGKNFSRVLAALGVPAAGVGAILIEGIMNRRALNLPAVVEAFDLAMDRMADWIDENYLDSHEAAAFAEEVYAAAIRLSQQEKRDYYATALANGLSKRRPPDEDRNRMIDVLERLRLPQLRLLAVARHHPFDVPLGSIVDLSSDNGFLQALDPSTPFDRLNMDWQDLRRAGLVENEPIPGSQFPGYASFFTGFGLEFDLFVRVPYSDVYKRRPGEPIRPAAAQTE
jgi:hypothetical protein